MKKNIIFQIIIIGLIFCLLSIAIPAKNEKPIRVGVFGGSLLSGPRYVGCFVFNSGSDPVYDIDVEFSVKGGTDNSIDFYHTDSIEELVYNAGYQYTLRGIKGFGPVTLTITAIINEEEIEETIQGFQIGPVTISKTFLLAYSDF